MMVHNRKTKVILTSKNPFVVQMRDSGFHQIVFRGKLKLPQVRAIKKFAIKEIFDWVVGIW